MFKGPGAALFFITSVWKGSLHYLFIYFSVFPLSHLVNVLTRCKGFREKLEKQSQANSDLKNVTSGFCHAGRCLFTWKGTVETRPRSLTVVETVKILLSPSLSFREKNLAKYLWTKVSDSSCKNLKLGIKVAAIETPEKNLRC